MSNFGKHKPTLTACEEEKQVLPCVFIDDEPPWFLTCPSHAAFSTDRGSPTGTVTWPSPTARDNSGDAPTVTCSPQQGSFAIGSYTVACNASDGADPPNVASNCTFNVTVRGINQWSKYALNNPIILPAKGNSFRQFQGHSLNKKSEV